MLCDWWGQVGWSGVGEFYWYDRWGVVVRMVVCSQWSVHYDWRCDLNVSNLFIYFLFYFFFNFKAYMHHLDFQSPVFRTGQTWQYILVITVTAKNNRKQELERFQEIIFNLKCSLFVNSIQRI